METRAVRATVAAMLVAAGISAGARVLAIDSRTTGALSRLQQLDSQLDDMLATVATVRGAQQAYFQPAGNQPAGSREQFEQVRALTETLERGIAALRPLLDSPDQADTWTRLTTTLHDFSATDTRVRANIRNETYFSAADLVFSASADMLGTLTTDLRALELRVDQDRRAAVTAARYDGWVALGAAAVVWLVGLGLLVPTRRAKQVQVTFGQASRETDGETGRETDSETSRELGSEPSSELGRYLGGAPLSQSISGATTEPVSQPVSEPAADAVRAAAVAPQAAPVAAGVPATASADRVPPEALPTPLAEVATLCTDIARVGSAAELRELLARVAGALHAQGVIVWMGAGEELFAAIGHGYPPQMIARLEPLRRDGRNAAAAAWREAEPQRVAGEPGLPGALVVPLMGVTGAVGALSCELPHGLEHDPALLSFAQLIAAQLSTVVAGWPAPSVVTDGESATTPDAGMSLVERLAANQ